MCLSWSDTNRSAHDWSKKTQHEKTQPTHRFGDVVIARKDSDTSYHLASVHDDIELGMTHIVRGDDLADAAGLHRLLYALFDAPAPIYIHHRLVMDDQGKRLAKRDKAATLRDMRARGLTPADVWNHLGMTPPA